jgi:hypothetical protein
MCWGIPSSGVLCIELLKQITLAPSQTHLPHIPRAEIVHNLSLLVGFLEWVRPTAGNYQLCRRMRQIIKRILGHIINRSPSLSAPSAWQEAAESSISQTFEDTGVGSLGPTMLQPDVDRDNLDDLDWLNSVDWSRAPWTDLAGEEFLDMRFL